MTESTKVSERIPLDKLLTEIRKFNRYSLLCAISKCSAEIAKEEGRMLFVEFPVAHGSYTTQEKALFTTPSLVVLTRLVLAHGSYRARRHPKFMDIARLDSWTRYLSPSIDAGRPHDMESLEEIIFQASYHQTPMQLQNELAQIGRALMLFEQIPGILSEEGYIPPIDLDQAFSDIWGMSLRQFIATGFIISVYAQSGEPMSIGKIRAFLTEELSDSWICDISDCPTPASCDKFLELTSLDFEGFRKKIGDVSLQDEQIRHIDTTPLPAYPIVRTGDDEIVVPSIKLFMDRISSGVFHDLANQFKGHDSQNSFRTYFGELFERYIGVLLEQVFPKNVLVRETSYRPPRHQNSTPDWTINGDTVSVGIECRSSSFTLDARLHGDMRLIIKDLDRIGVQTLQRAPKKQSDLMAGGTPIVLKSKKVPRIGLCTWEYLYPVDLFGALLARQLPSVLAQGFNFFLVPVAYLERICAFRDPALFEQALAVLTFDRRWEDPLDEGVFARLDRSLPEKPLQNPPADDLADAFFDCFNSASRSQHRE